MVPETILMVILLRFGIKVLKKICWYTVCIPLYQFVFVRTIRYHCFNCQPTVKDQKQNVLQEW